MANIKISELDELQKATDQDLLVIVDVDNNRTKKIQTGNLGILVPKTTKTTSDTETYSCNYVNNEVDKLLPENSKTTGTTNTYSCDYINGIVESGSNENGSWVKYNNGIMICYNSQFFGSTPVTKTTTVTGIHQSEDKLTLNNFPMEFISEPTVNVTLKNTTYNMWVVANGDVVKNNITAGSYNIIRLGTPATINITLEYIAIGRWK